MQQGASPCRMMFELWGGRGDGQLLSGQWNIAYRFYIRSGSLPWQSLVCWGKSKGGGAMGAYSPTVMACPGGRGLVSDRV
jgi:hypothetical protein